MSTEMYSALREQLEYLEAAYNLNICVKDYVGFIPIDKALSSALMPYVGHNNPYCMFIKQDLGRYHHCLSMMKKIAKKCLAETSHFSGTCYAGVREIVVPVRWKGKLLGVVTVGFLPVSFQERDERIQRAMKDASEADLLQATELYQANILESGANEQVILPAIKLIADFLALTYRMGQESVTGQQLVSARKTENADTIFNQAIKYIRHEYKNHISVSALAAHCACSESYLNHMLKKRLGVSVSTYVNKIRIEHAKDYLLNSNHSVLTIAMQVGFQDSNYFARVFKQLIGIQPTEFRRRYRA